MLSIVTHEYAHVFAFKQYGKKVKIRWGFPTIKIGYEDDYLFLTKNQKIGVYGFGVISGLWVWFIAVALLGDMFLFGFAAYLLSCKNDIKNLIITIKRAE